MRFKSNKQTGSMSVEFTPEESRFLGVPSGSPPFSLKRILVPVDFSECSKKALAYAVPFARQFKAELVLINVLSPYPVTPEMAPIGVEDFEGAAIEMEKVRELVGEGVAVKTLLRKGSPHLEIFEAAKELEADLIILATHGRTGLAHLLLGSTTEKVVRQAPCPVLVVREKQHEFVTENLDSRQTDSAPNFEAAA
ncbi:MAG TPA: universal stress protein [Clostridia bacterium]|nr:universal stress protein [Clostridia bacterium]